MLICAHEEDEGKKHRVEYLGISVNLTTHTSIRMTLKLYEE
jgi:hypothetical protein